MEDIIFKHDKTTNTYWASFSKEKSCAIVFYEEKVCESYCDIVYSVAFGVGKSRKQILNWALYDRRYIKNQITGDGDASYLIFAYNALLCFEKYIKEKYPNRVMSIEIFAADEKRWSVYSYYLKKINYSCVVNRFNIAPFNNMMRKII